MAENSPSFLVHFVRTIFLRPYGSSLLRPSAGAWIIFMSILALAMAVVEGSVWGVISSIILPEAYRKFSLAVGLLIASFIWIFDASLITLDLSEPLYKKDNTNKKNLLIRIFLGVFSKKLGWGVFMRVAVVTGSILITAPLLGQIFLEKDILSRIESHNKSEVVRIGKERRKLYLSDIGRLSGRRDKLQDKLQREISGTGQSGRYGRGPAARAIESEIDQISKDIRALEEKKTREMNKIESSTISELAKKYKLNPLTDNFETRNKIHNKIRKEEGGIPKSELLASVFLGLIFIIMAMLKVFQGRSVDIYFNDHMQEYYKMYLNGHFNDMIEKKEYPNGISPMNAYRFQEWIHNVYIVKQKNDEVLADKAQAEENIKKTIDELDFDEGKQRKIIDPISEELETSQKLYRNRVNDRQEQDILLRGLMTELGSLSTKIRIMEQTIGENSNAESIAVGFGKLDEWREQERKFTSEKKEIETALSSIDIEVDRLDVEIEASSVRLAKEQKILDDIIAARHRLQLEKLSNAERMVSAALSRLSRVDEELKT